MLSIENFYSKCDQIRRNLRIWSHLLKKSLMENFIFLCSLPFEDFSSILQDGNETVNHNLRIMANAFGWIDNCYLPICGQCLFSVFSWIKKGSMGLKYGKECIGLRFCCCFFSQMSFNKVNIFFKNCCKAQKHFKCPY